MKFDVLYHFSHGPIHVVETKRTDLPSNATPPEVYQWFYIDDRQVHRLQFESMSLNPQQRIFQEGMIRFDLISCHGRLNGRDLELTRQDKMGSSLRMLIEESLRAKGKAP